jgi:hypothetical protein
VALAVAADEASPIERADEVERLARQRARGEVAAEDDQIRLDLLELGQDRLQRREVAVNVVEGPD